MRIAVTGATGFVGSALVRNLAGSAHQPVPIDRAALAAPDFSTIDAVVHCAAIAHRRDVEAATIDAVNHRLAVDLAREAANQSVRRFVFVSSVAVIAGNTPPLRAGMPPKPLDGYGASKAAAERDLLRIDGIDVVVARPALIYGPAAPGNLRALFRLAGMPVPLPFGDARNRRSLVSISNVARALTLLATDSRVAARSTWLLAEPQPFSTAGLVTTWRQAMRRPVWLLPVPRCRMVALMTAVGQGRRGEQLFGDLEIDGSAIEDFGFVYEDGHSDLEAMVKADRKPGRNGGPGQPSSLVRR